LLLAIAPQSARHPGRAGSGRHGDLLLGIELEHVSRLGLLIVFQNDTTLKAFCDFFDILGESLERGYLALVNLGAIAQQAHEIWLPTIVPMRGMRKMANTRAWPITVSLNSGSSIPLSAFSTSSISL
jgi:hypothetical protein